MRSYLEELKVLEEDWVFDEYKNKGLYTQTLRIKSKLVTQASDDLHTVKKGSSKR